MAVNKVIYGGNTLVDLTGDTVTAADLADGVKATGSDGNSFDYDEKARDRINAAIIALSLQGEGASIDWTTADNQDVKVTANDLRMVIAAVAVRSNKLHTAYRIAKEKVEEATTATDVEAVSFEI